MSSISSGLDPVIKYQRLSAEYVKVRNQVSVLKTALVEEQAKSADLQRELTSRDTRLRKVESERDSLLFRNEQLVKRVESLQESLEAQMATFGMGKGKKKHKEANLRLMAESARMQHQQALGGGGPSASDPQLVLEEELERKILENGELHSKLFDVERRLDEVTGEFLQRIDELQRENAALRISSSADDDDDHLPLRNGTGGRSKQRSRVENEEGASNAEEVKSATHLTNGNTDTGGKSIVSGGAGTSAGSDCGSLGTGEQRQQQHFSSSPSSRPGMMAPATNSSRSSDGKPSDSAISLDSVEPAAEAESEEMAAKRKALEDYYTERIGTLTKSLQHATGRASYYKQECEELLRRNMAEHQELEAAQKKHAQLEDKCAMLYDTLETTQQNYEEQMRQLYEHMAEQDAKIVEQADRLVMNSVNQQGHAAQLRQKKKAGSAENGRENGEEMDRLAHSDAAERAEHRTSWFSSNSTPTTSK